MNLRRSLEKPRKANLHHDIESCEDDSQDHESCEDDPPDHELLIRKPNSSTVLTTITGFSLSEIVRVSIF